MAEAEPSRSIVTLDVAKSNRSTCKATGEKIEKGEHRVGVEAYSGGHISMTWQVCSVYRLPVLPFGQDRISNYTAMFRIANISPFVTTCCGSIN